MPGVGGKTVARAQALSSTVVAHAEALSCKIVACFEALGCKIVACVEAPSSTISLPSGPSRLVMIATRPGDEKVSY